MSPLLKLAAPGALVVLPAALLLSFAPASPALARAAEGYPYAALGAAALLAWRFQRSRLLAAAAALAFLPAAPAPAAALLPLVLALLAAGADRRLAASRALLQVGLVGAACGAARLLPRDLVAGTFAAGLSLPELGGLLLLGLLALHRRRSPEAGLFWAAVAGVLGAAAPPPARGVWLLAGALSLLLALVEAAHALAFRDELTDLPGRRALAALLGSLRPPYAVAVVDVDHFKRFNDRYGHDVGDQVLRMVAARLARAGGGGRAFRSGGEEFTIVFPGCTPDQAMPHLEALRRAVAGSPFVPRRSLRRGAERRGKTSRRRGLRITISVGVAGPARGGNPEATVKAADRAMYRAKEAGRNRVRA